jgi:hypothetical protein
MDSLISNSAEALATRASRQGALLVYIQTRFHFHIENEVF